MTDTFCCANCGRINIFDFSRWGGAEKAGVMNQADLSPSHPEAIRSRVVGEMLWCIDQARSQGDYEAVAAYAMDLAALK